MAQLYNHKKRTRVPPKEWHNTFTCVSNAIDIGIKVGDDDDDDEDGSTHSSANSKVEVIISDDESIDQKNIQF